MTTAEHAATFLQAHLEGFIPSLLDFPTIDEDADTCTSDCDICPATCSKLSADGDHPSYSLFLKNYAPIHEYLLHHHPEAFI